MTSTNINYSNIYFEFPALTKIHNTPNYPTLRVLKDETKENKVSVMSNLGWGVNGQLGILSTPTVYVNIPETTPYVRPTNPGTITIEHGTSQHIIAILRSDHKDTIKFLQEMNDVKMCD